MTRKQLIKAIRTVLIAGIVLVWVAIMAFDVYGSYVKEPRNYRPYLNLSAIHFEQGEYSWSLAYAEKALSIDPTRPEGYMNAASAAIKLQAWQQAYGFTKRHYEIQPDLNNANNLIQLCLILGKREEAARVRAELPNIKPMKTNWELK